MHAYVIRITNSAVRDMDHDDLILVCHFCRVAVGLHTTLTSASDPCAIMDLHFLFSCKLISLCNFCLFW